MHNNTDSETVCCPSFNPDKWDNQVFEWKEKKFIKDKVFSLFYMPLNFGAVMKRLDEKVKKTGIELDDNLCLSDHTSKWNMDIYLAVDKDVPDTLNAALTGKFLFKVYEGPYKDTAKWCADFESYSKSRNFDIKKWFMWYTTCPKCAKKYGKNFVVVIARVEDIRL